MTREPTWTPIRIALATTYAIALITLFIVI